MARVDEIVMLEDALKEARAALQKHQVRRNQVEAEKKTLQEQVEERTADVELSLDHLHTVLGREVVDLKEYEKARNLLHQAQDNLQGLSNRIITLCIEQEKLEASAIPEAEASVKTVEGQLGQYGKVVPFKA